MPAVGERRARQAADWGGAMKNQQRCFAPAQMNNHLNAITLHKGIVAGHTIAACKLVETRWRAEVEAISCLGWYGTAMLDGLGIDDGSFCFPDTQLLWRVSRDRGCGVYDLIVELADEGGCMIASDEVPPALRDVFTRQEWEVPFFDDVAGLGEWNLARLYWAMSGADRPRDRLEVAGDLAILSIYREAIMERISESVEARRLGGEEHRVAVQYGWEAADARLAVMAERRLSIPA